MNHLTRMLLAVAALGILSATSMASAVPATKASKVLPAPKAVKAQEVLRKTKIYVPFAGPMEVCLPESFFIRQDAPAPDCF